MIGTVFHVKDVSYDEIEKSWVIKLELEEDRRKITEDDSVPNINNSRVILKTAVRALLQRFDSISTSDINIVFNQIFELFPVEKNWLMAVKFHCLANHEEGRYDSIFNVFERKMDSYMKALTIWHDYVDDRELNCHLDIADIHREIAQCYAHYSVKNYEQTTFHCDLALTNYKLAQESVLIGNNEKTSVYEKLHDIYQMKMMIDDRGGIIEMALQNREDHVKHMLTFCHPNDVRIARSLEELAKLYKSVNKYDEVVINYEKALEIYRHQTPSDQDIILLLAEEIADIYKKHKHDPSSALKYQEIIRSIDSKEKLKFGHFMTAAKLHKERTGLNTND
jgi:tetratricopeptide (TPR) repeat protein